MADLPTGRTFAAFLFDMDGTLLDSIPSANRAWSKWAAEHGVDFEEMRKHMHGMRAVETIKRWGPAHLDVEAEYEALTIAEMEDVHDITAISGAASCSVNLISVRQLGQTIWGPVMIRILS